MISFAISFACIYLFFYVFHFYPFGTGTLATVDANIQYIDFFSYLKDVLSGSNSIAYTFSDTLGGDTLSIVSYYLASPFNLLLLLFPKSEILTFFNLACALKISMCALTMSIFLSCRFGKKLRPVFVLLLSLSYAFMQYNLTQADNIMWLDGVYMLPLMLLGVYKAINDKNLILLSVSTGLCIIFNWYIAGMCCLFTIIWFFFECGLRYLDINNGKFDFKDMLASLLIYGSGMVIALLLSAGLFLPTVYSMLGGKGVDCYFSYKFIGNILNAVTGYRLGAISTNGNPSLYCGSIAVIGAGCLFISKEISRKHKLLFCGMFLFVLMTLFWQPLYMLFSLLRPIGSHLIRHAFLSIFALIFMSAYFFSSSTQNRAKYVLTSVFSFSLLLLLLEYISPSIGLQSVYYTIIAAVAAALLATVVLRSRAACVMSVFVLLAELGVNTILLILVGQGADYSEYTRQYQIQQQEQISDIKDYDTGFYRIAQTVKRTGASYNDSMAYAFASNAGFTSCTDNDQLDFLERLGYRTEGECITIVEDPVIAADSLLGVKYVISDTPIVGLEPVNQIESRTGTVYQNPYCLPMAYVISDFDRKDYEYTNPFEYHNQLFSRLTGINTGLYKRLDSTRTDTDSGFEYTFEMPRGNYVLYGNFDIEEYSQKAVLNLNGKKTINYGSWLSRSVFSIPAQGGESVSIDVSADDTGNFSEAQFYALDLDVLKTVSDKLSENAITDINFDDDRIYGSVYSENGGYAVLAVPYSENWSFEINGVPAEPLALGEGLTVLPISAGENIIDAKYTIPFLTLGILISVVGVLILIAVAVITYNKRIRDRLFKIINTPAMRYLIAGGATTLVNLVVFTFLCRVINVEVNLSNIISVFCAIIFAYIVNKIYVFNSKCPSAKSLWTEFIKFVGARGFTMIIEVGGVFLLYNIIGQNELIAKIETQVIVLILNYIISKFLVFNKNTREA